MWLSCCGGLDFVRRVLACYVQSCCFGLLVWTFHASFPLSMSNLSALAPRFGLFMLLSRSPCPIFTLWLDDLDFSSLVSAFHVQSVGCFSLFWTLQHVFTPVMSNPPATFTRISYGCQKSHLTPATFYLLCIFFDILSDCLNAVEVFLTNTCHLNTEFIINISDDFK